MISIFDLFSIGIGPSSSHTVGPMKAAHRFARELSAEQLAATTRVSVELFGSLAHTGKGHGTDKAILLGLEGNLPDQVLPSDVSKRFAVISEKKQLQLANKKPLIFHPEDDLYFNYTELLPDHSNAMRFTIYDQTNHLLIQKIYYSIGGGFIISNDHENIAKHTVQSAPYVFATWRELEAICQKQQWRISDVVIANEKIWRDASTIRTDLLKIVDVMRDSIERGLHHDGILPGGLHIKRRAPGLYQKLQAIEQPASYKDHITLRWLNAFAIAVNEENAAGERIVTAPTNGAAGVIPAVLEYYLRFYPQANEDAIIEFLLTAGAIAILYKKGASISAAEVGCQGEIGVACSMAAAALAAVLCPHPDDTHQPHPLEHQHMLTHVETAAEMAMEHHLGLTCDPVAGLVQIPCIERNAIAATKAVNIAQLVLLEKRESHISLDKVIATMKQTGHDMSVIYKETSTGGLAVNIPEC